MNVMKPEVYWVNDRCYRKNPSKNNYDLTATMDFPIYSPPEQTVHLAPYQEHESCVSECDPFAPDESDDNYQIEKINEGFKTRVYTIPSSLFPHIIGAKGATKKRIEYETNTKIVVPRQNEKGDIVIRGQSQKAVVSCRRRLELIASEARLKREATHFICYPLNSPHLVEKFHEFKKLVQSKVFGLDDIFQQPEKMHLTICVLILMDERERKLCAEILTKLKEEIIDIIQSDKLRFRLKGLEIMNDDATTADVLYAKCDLPDDKAQRVADLIALRFAESGFSKIGRSDSVKLHCTVMNTRYRAEKKAGAELEGTGDTWRKGSRTARESFNAESILKEFGTFDFGMVEVDHIFMSTRHTKGSDGFYNSYSKISL